MKHLFNEEIEDIPIIAGEGFDESGNIFTVLHGQRCEL